MRPCDALRQHTAASSRWQDAPPPATARSSLAGGGFGGNNLINQAVGGGYGGYGGGLGQASRVTWLSAVDGAEGAHECLTCACTRCLNATQCHRRSWSPADQRTVGRGLRRQQPHQPGPRAMRRSGAGTDPASPHAATSSWQFPLCPLAGCWRGPWIRLRWLRLRRLRRGPGPGEQTDCSAQLAPLFRTPKAHGSLPALRCKGKVWLTRGLSLPKPATRPDLQINALSGGFGFGGNNAINQAL